MLLRLHLAILIVIVVTLHSVAAESLATLVDQDLASVPNGGLAAVLVREADGATTLFEHNAQQPLRLASITKLMVSASALWDLGSDFQFDTKLVALGPVTDGAIPGLGVIGGGSPCLDEHFFDKDPNRVFADWAKELGKLGVTTVRGDVVIDNSLFSGPCKPTTYPQDAENQQRWYSAPASAFAWNDNCIEVRVVPGKPGEPGDVQIRPRSARITIRNQTKSVAEHGAKNISVRRDAAANAVTVTGSYQSTTDWFPLAIHEDPDLLAGDHLKALLESAKITVTGKVVIGSVKPDAGPLIAELKQDLVPAIDILNQRSQNFYGEQILRMLGVHKAKEGSIAAGCKSLLGILAEHCSDISSVTVVDGCGLSYDNQASAAFIADLLVLMHKSKLADIYRESLKDMNSNRVKGRVKTGTHALASNLAGYLDRPNGGIVIFVILLNKGTAANFGWAGGLRDKLFKDICIGIQ